MAVRHEVQISWTVLASAVGLIILVVGAFWTLAFSPINERINALVVRDSENRAEFTKNSTERRQEIQELQRELERRRDGVFVGLKEFNSLQNEVSSHHKALLEDIRGIKTIVLEARSGGVYVLSREFQQFEANILQRLEAIDKTIGLIQTTRPTTGELQAVARGNEAIANQLEIRVRSLEDYIRAARPQPIQR